MKNLLIDIGNSSIKSSTAEIGCAQIGSVKRNDYCKTDFLNEFENHLSIYNDDKEVQLAGISLLDKSKINPISEIVKKIFNVTPVFIGTDSLLPFELNYENSIGSDRLCSSTCAFFKSKSDTILTIDFGTATTYTVVHKKVLIGGMISPGIGTSYKALISRTTLPESDLTFPESPVSNKTSENISGGVLYQSLYATEKYIETIKKSFGSAFVICTGGFSSLIMSRASMIDEHDPNLVLAGINLIISK